MVCGPKRREAVSPRREEAVSPRREENEALPDNLDFVIEIVSKMDGQEGIEVLPQRWVLEGNFGWMVRWKRLVRDYEQRIDVSEAMIHVAMGSLLLKLRNSGRRTKR